MWYKSPVEEKLTISAPKSSRKALLCSSDPIVYLGEMSERCFVRCTGSEMEWCGLCLTVVIVCTYLITIEAEKLFMFMDHLFFSSAVKCLFVSFPLFSNELLVFF